MNWYVRCLFFEFFLNYCESSRSILSKCKRKSTYQRLSQLKLKSSKKRPEAWHRIKSARSFAGTFTVRYFAETFSVHSFAGAFPVASFAGALSVHFLEGAFSERCFAGAFSVRSFKLEFWLIASFEWIDMSDASFLNFFSIIARVLDQFWASVRGNQHIRDWVNWNWNHQKNGQRRGTG